MKNLTVTTSIAASIMTLSLGTSVAMASTTSSSAKVVQVVHAAYMITAPKLGSTKLQLEPVGTQLTLEQGGNSYWYHVEAPNGKSGYITTTTYYTEELNASSSSTSKTASSSTSTSTSTATSPSSVATSTSAPSSTSNPTVEVLNSAYLIAQPATGSTRIELEQVGTQLTLESGGNSYWYHVQAPDGKSGYITTSSYYTKEVTNAPTVSLPPGITLDPSITPIAGVNASATAKFNAILQVAESKLGTPYELDHNEDRGQTGFDCSNFVEYVYHHALGYVFSTASKTQYTSVGTTVPTADMQPGDLLSFNDGGHSGIYVGNNQMIQCGGGLGKVGYLSVAPGSYWYNHLSAVKRMY